MKTRFSALAAFGLALLALPLFTGCQQDGANQTGLLIGTANAEPSVDTVNSNALAEVANTTTNLADASLTGPEGTVAESTPTPNPAPAPASETERKLPANLKPSMPAGEVIKLAQAGVEQNVMLNYVTNSSGVFNLSSDDIIYLNDLGVPAEVVTAMMQHDQSLKAFWANQAATQAANAAAPTYVNPPQPEAQPTPTAAAPATTVVEQPPVANVTYSYFYDSLSPYGTWVDIDGYGRCWQPTVVVVNPGWRPYSDHGHWVYSDCGWYWVSDYSWGWAPFHYGRWFSHPRYGWCWWPDRVWGPSWVSWRYSNDYCGWAPLPPAAYYRSGFGFSYHGSSVGFGFEFGLGADFYTFVSWNNFCDSRPWHHRLPPRRAREVYHHTTIVNNYGTGNHNTVINHGVPVDRVRERTREALHVVSIRDRNPSEIRSGRGERLENNGRSLVVHRPRIPESAAPKMPSEPRTTTYSPAGSRERARQFGQPSTPLAGSPRSAVPTPSGPKIENDRSRATERPPELRRETSRSQGASPGKTPATPSSAPRTFTPTTPAPSRIAPTSPAVQPSPGSPRSPQEQRGEPGRERRRDSSQVPVTSPTVVNAPSSPAVTTPPAQNANRNQLIVIGRRPQETTPSTSPIRPESRVANSQNSYNWVRPSAPSPARDNAIPSTPHASPVPTRGATTIAPQRQESRITQPSWPNHSSQPAQRTVTAPPQTFSAPRPAAPTFSAPSPAPAQRTYSPPQRSFSAPRPAAPTYSAPAPAPVQRSQPSPPAYRTPAPSPAPSYSPPSQSFSRPSEGTQSRSDNGGFRGRQPR